MATKDTFDGSHKAFYHEVVLKDCYMLKPWGSDFFDHIIDIGANIGVFITYAHMRHPEAKIFAYEPCKETFDYLCNSMYIKHMKNVACFNEALGDGSDLFLHDTGYSGCNQFFKEGEGKLDRSYSVPSLSLSDIFRKNQIPLDGNYCIKIDCEGGERFLLDDNESIHIMKNACNCAMEVHFPPVGSNPRKSSQERFETFPTWDTYNTWINDNFLATHDITYHCSVGRHGAGVYALKRKKAN